MSKVVVSSHETPHGTVRSYTVGFILSIVLTLAAYLMVVHELASGWALIFWLASLAIVQLFVQLLFFLHLGREAKPRWNLQVMVFAAGVVGIVVFGNLLTAAAGFLLAASIQHHFDITVFYGVLVGTGLVIACGCVANNYIDRSLDRKMSRTRKRASVTGEIPLRTGIIYSVILGLTGFLILAVYTNWLTFGVGALGLFFYLVMYSVGKRRSVWGTVIGSVSGATPILAGYTAVTGQIDAGAVTLFLIMTFWQMPHFYTIAMYRFKDYQAAGLPVLPIKKGMEATKLQIIGFVIAFMAATTALSILGYTGYIFALVMASLGIFWLWRGVSGFKAQDDIAWGKSMFLYSLNVLVALSVMVAVGAILP
jgi:protoheme IX farnesyltransferase